MSHRPYNEEATRRMWQCVKEDRNSSFDPYTVNYEGIGNALDDGADPNGLRNGKAILYFIAHDEGNAGERVEIARKLLEKGINLDAPEIHAAWSDFANALLRDCLAVSSYDGVSLCLQLGANPNVIPRRSGGLLHYLARTGSQKPPAERLRVMEEAILAGASLSHPSDMGAPLFIAAANGHPDTVRLFLKHRANPDIADRKGVRPLHVANCPETVFALMEAKAELSLADAMDRTPPQAWDCDCHKALLAPECQRAHRPLLRKLYDGHFATLSPGQQAVWREHFDPSPEQRADARLPEHSAVRRYIKPSAAGPRGGIA